MHVSLGFVFKVLQYVCGDSTYELLTPVKQAIKVIV